jgi:hypothetical protein
VFKVKRFCVCCLVCVLGLRGGLIFRASVLGKRLCFCCLVLIYNLKEKLKGCAIDNTGCTLGLFWKGDFICGINVYCSGDCVWFCVVYVYFFGV